MFSAYLTQDVYVDDVVVLPKGTIVRGNTADVVPDKKVIKISNPILEF